MAYSQSGFIDDPTSKLALAGPWVKFRHITINFIYSDSTGVLNGLSHYTYKSLPHVWYLQHSTWNNNKDVFIKCIETKTCNNIAVIMEKRNSVCLYKIIKKVVCGNNECLNVVIGGMNLHWCALINQRTRIWTWKGKEPIGPNLERILWYRNRTISESERNWTNPCTETGCSLLNFPSDFTTPFRIFHAVHSFLVSSPIKPTFLYFTFRNSCHLITFDEFCFRLVTLCFLLYLCRV